MREKLYKSDTDRKLTGVCGGLAEYFDVDPTLMRIGWVIFCCLAGSGILAYILCAIIMPHR